MKIALVLDHLTCRGGGERVALTFHRAYPMAPIYTMTYNSEETFPEFKECDIRTSWFQKISNKNEVVKRLFFPLGVLAMRSLKLDGFDVVLAIGTHCGKYVRVSKEAIFINYCFTPFRLAWNPESYSEYENSSFLKKASFNLVISALKFLDRKYSKRVDYFMAMTEETKERLIKAYSPKNHINVFNPSLTDIEKYTVSSFPKVYYLVVGRLEFYKKVDLVIKTFNNLDLSLIIVGRGSREEELKKLAKSPRIEFFKDITDAHLIELYSNCKAFIFPQYEDYGLTAIEANAAGRPVIAYKKGGVLDTQIDFNKDSVNGTAILFEEQSIESLTRAIQEFEKKVNLFNPEVIRKNAERFSEEGFISNTSQYIESLFKLAK